jgi:putative Mg2+ transporter-C (MgtC) family protein
MSFWEIVLRLGVATVVGGLIGLNRDMHGKPTGVRTLGLVALGSALIVLGVADLGPPGSTDPNPVSRVVQGVLTGIGFLGAGVILHGANQPRQVHGLTTAATTWLTACIGLICGTGNWRLLVVGVALLFMLLMFGGPIERHFRLPFRHPEEPPPDGEQPLG